MRSEAGISVGNDFTGSAVVWKNMLDIEVGNIGCSSHFMAGNEDDGFEAVMVRDSEDAVKAVGKREFDSEVHSDVFKGKGSVISGDRAVWCVEVSCNGFGGLAGGATTDERGDEVLHVGPPVVFGEEKAGFQDTRMTHCGGVMI